ncbi:MAG: sigma-70 family RNA polymerase sigma factor [Sediminibacterium sp.]|nr:sigma-70 family RNA polymerase sigma factor [Sediminibacterium sp.]
MSLTVLKEQIVKGEPNEQALLKGLANNDSKAIETIYKDNFNMVQSFILNNNGSYDEARDIFQEAMIALYEKAQTESFVLTCQIKTYVYSICRRLWLKRLQQLGRYSQQVDSLEETVAVEEDLETHEKRNAEFTIMDRALNSLGEPCKSLLEGYYLKKMDMLALAQEFGYTNADNAKNQKYKCLMRLKKLFFSQYNIGE